MSHALNSILQAVRTNNDLKDVALAEADRLRARLRMGGLADKTFSAYAAQVRSIHRTLNAALDDDLAALSAPPPPSRLGLIAATRERIAAELRARGR